MLPENQGYVKQYKNDVESRRYKDVVESRRYKDVVEIWYQATYLLNFYI